MSAARKTGRKAIPFKCPWNDETVDGLYRCKDDRWKIVATGQKYAEPDPRLAVLRFRQWQAQQTGRKALIELPFPLIDTDHDLHGAVEFLLRSELGAGQHRGKEDRSNV